MHKHAACLEFESFSNFLISLAFCPPRLSAFLSLFLHSSSHHCLICYVYLSSPSLLHQHTPHDCISLSQAHYFLHNFYFLCHSKAQCFAPGRKYCTELLNMLNASYLPPPPSFLSCHFTPGCFPLISPNSHRSTIQQSLIARRGKSYSLFAKKRMSANVVHQLISTVLPAAVAEVLFSKALNCDIFICRAMKNRSTKKCLST